MTKLNYTNYLKKEDFDFKEQYYNDLISITKFEKPYESIDTRYKRYLKSGTFRDVFKKYSLYKIVLADYVELKIIIKDIDDNISQLTERKKKNLISKIQNLFKYSKKFQGTVLTPFFTDNFNFRTCFYCNKDFITNFEKEKNILSSTFQLDHFYDKGTYPYLALSFYNLIPSCPTCNSSKVKGSENCFKTCIPPNDEKFDFENKVKFKLLLDVNCKNLHVEDKKDIDVPLKEQFSNEYDKYIEIFKLNERYKAHKDIVYEMITKAELYPESRLKELQNLTGIPFQQIKKDIFNLSDEKDLSKKPFSKLIKDMSEELGLV
jgi:hypothetical protein